MEENRVNYGGKQGELWRCIFYVLYRVKLDFSIVMNRMESYFITPYVNTAYVTKQGRSENSRKK